MKYIIGFIISSVFTLGFITKDIISWFNNGSAFNSTYLVLIGLLGIIISVAGILWQSMTVEEYKEPINKMPMWWR